MTQNALNNIRGIAISGKQGAGKSTLQTALRAALLAQGIESQNIAFAEPLKEAVRRIVRSMGIKLEDDWKYRHRRELQVLGTTLREYHEDVWVDIAIERTYRIPPGTVALVDDLRYWNEARKLHENEFFLVRIEASEALRGSRVQLSGTDHASETDLDDFDGWDMVFNLDTEPLLPDEMANIIVRQIMARKAETPVEKAITG